MQLSMLHIDRKLNIGSSKGPNPQLTFVVICQKQLPVTSKPEVRYCYVLLLLLLLLFPRPIYYLRASFSLSLLVVTLSDPGSHTRLSSPPPH